MTVHQLARPVFPRCAVNYAHTNEPECFPHSWIRVSISLTFTIAIQHCKEWSAVRVPAEHKRIKSAIIFEHSTELHMNPICSKGLLAKTLPSCIQLEWSPPANKHAWHKLDDPLPRSVPYLVTSMMWNISSGYACSSIKKFRRLFFAVYRMRMFHSTPVLSKRSVPVMPAVTKQRVLLRL